MNQVADHSLKEGEKCRLMSQGMIYRERVSTYGRIAAATEYCCGITELPLIRGSLALSISSEDLPTCTQLINYSPVQYSRRSAQKWRYHDGSF